MKGWTVCSCGQHVTGRAGQQVLCNRCGRPLFVPEVETRGRGLAIASLVLSCLFCLPIFPLVGVGLAIAALVKMKGRPNAPGKWLAIASLIVAAVVAVPSAGLMAAVSIPAFLRYVRHAKQAEAEGNLARIALSVQAYHVEHGRLPEPAPRTPETPCSRGADGRCGPGDPGASGWHHPTWQALGFLPDDRHYFQYELQTDETGFVARAIGDLDADGIFSTYERYGEARPGQELWLAPELRSFLEGE